MPKRPHLLITGARITSLGTLVSRVLGMFRDMATASLLGMSGGGVMDAFVIAFRIPNTFRRLFGEGALAASYLPVLTGELARDRAGAWKVASVLFACLGLGLLGLTLLLQAACGLLWLIWGDIAGISLVAGLAAVMMPYMLFICIAAQAAATLQSLGQFTVPALAPALLNICWLGGAVAIAPSFSAKPAQAYVLAVCIVVSGVLQMGWQLWALRGHGYRYDFDWSASRGAMAQVGRSMLPMLFGLAITQVNTLVDSLLAWGLAVPAAGDRAIEWLGGAIDYPLTSGAAASIYYGERLYEFPLSLVGIAVATAIYPLLSRHAAGRDWPQLGRDLSLGLRLVLFLGIPAGAGLALLAEPIARLLFERGEFTPDDTLRAARVIACYSAGVPAFCAAPVLVRGLYSIGRQATPAKIGAAIVLVNLTLNLLLVWPFAEAGLAAATSFSIWVQAATLMAVLAASGKAPIDWAALVTTAARCLSAALVMAAGGWWATATIADDGRLTGRLIRVAVPLAISAATYLAVYRLIGGRELEMIVRGRE